MPLIGASIHYELEMEKKIYWLGKVDDRILVLQLTRSRSRKQKEPDIQIKKGFKLGSRLDWENVKGFKSEHKLNCDQLIYMHHTQIN